MSDNDFGAPRYKKGDPLTAQSLTKFTDGVRSSPLRRNPGGLTRRTPSGQYMLPHIVNSNNPSSTSLVYIEIAGTSGVNTYTGTIYDNPTDRTDDTKEEAVTVYAKQHSAGVIPNSGAGKGFWCVKGNDDKYYITNYSVAYG